MLSSQEVQFWKTIDEKEMAERKRASDLKWSIVQEFSYNDWWQQWPSDGCNGIYAAMHLWGLKPNQSFCVVHVGHCRTSSKLEVFNLSAFLFKFLHSI